MSATPREGVEAAHAAFGRHEGFRALHAKGTLLRGTFTATPDAATLSRAGHLQGEPVPVTVRVSNGGGNPKVPDYAPDVRGLAVKFYLPDGSRTDIVAQTAPRFVSRDPEPFLELMRIQGAGAAAALKLPAFLARNPRVAANAALAAPTLMPPPSYAAIRYYALHAYRLLDADGGSRYVRYTIVPERPQRRLAPWQARRLGRDYLQDEITRRVNGGGARFRVEAQIAEPSDPVDDASAPWPKERRRVTLGTVELTGLDTEREQGDDVLVFDPCRVVDGIELSDDPILRFRSPAYAESVRERSGVGPQPGITP